MKDPDRDAWHPAPNPIHSTQDHLSLSRKNSQSLSNDHENPKKPLPEASVDRDASRPSRAPPETSPAKNPPPSTAGSLHLFTAPDRERKIKMNPDPRTLDEPQKAARRLDSDSSRVQGRPANSPARPEEPPRDPKIVYINSTYEKLERKPAEAPAAKEQRAADSTDSRRKAPALSIESRGRAQPGQPAGLQHLPFLGQLTRHQKHPSDSADLSKSKLHFPEASLSRGASKSRSRSQMEQDREPSALHPTLHRQQDQDPVSAHRSREASPETAQNGLQYPHFPAPDKNPAPAKHWPGDAARTPSEEISRSRKPGSSKHSLSQLLKKPARNERPPLLGNSGGHKSYLLPGLRASHQAAAASKSLNNSLLEARLLADSKARRRTLSEVSRDINRLLEQAALGPPVEAGEIHRESEEMERLLAECQAAAQVQRAGDPGAWSLADSYQRSTVAKVEQKCDRDAELNRLVILSMEAELERLAASVEQRTKPE